MNMAGTEALCAPVWVLTDATVPFPAFDSNACLAMSPPSAFVSDSWRLLVSSETSRGGASIAVLHDASSKVRFAFFPLLVEIDLHRVQQPSDTSVGRLKIIDNPVSYRITAAVSDLTGLDADAVDVARKAAADAVTFASRDTEIPPPKIFVSSDGIVTLQWRNDDAGAALIFAGNGVATVALKVGQKRYSHDSGEFDVTTDAPANFLKMLRSFSRV